MKRSEIRDKLEEWDREATKKGVREAERYLRTKQPLPTQGRIREAIAGIAFLILATAIIFIGMAL